MVKNNGLPADLSNASDGQHTVLINPIMEIIPPLGLCVRRSIHADYNNDFSQAEALLVLLGTHPGRNQKIPLYYRIIELHVII